VVERGPEKAGVGGSIPSLATILDQQRHRDRNAVDPIVATFWMSFLTDGHGALVVYLNARYT
jgi:hypothetical protein